MFNLDIEKVEKNSWMKKNLNGNRRKIINLPTNVCVWHNVKNEKQNQSLHGEK